MSKVSLWDTPVELLNTNSSKKVLIYAGINKYNRQEYLGGYKDCSDWYISIVPYVTTYDKAEKLIKKATKQLSSKIDQFGRKTYIPQFEIKEVSDTGC